MEGLGETLPSLGSVCSSEQHRLTLGIPEFQSEGPGGFWEPGLMLCLREAYCQGVDKMVERSRVQESGVFPSTDWLGL